MSPSYTVIGYWNDADQVVVTGIIRGEHGVFGGYGCSTGGPWATSFEALNDDHAEKVATEEARAAGADEDDEDHVYEVDEENQPVDLDEDKVRRLIAMDTSSPAGQPRSFSLRLREQDTAWNPANPVLLLSGPLDVQYIEDTHGDVIAMTSTPTD